MRLSRVSLFTVTIFLHVAKDLPIENFQLGFQFTGLTYLPRIIIVFFFCFQNERVNSILQIFGPHVAREQWFERHTTRVENVVRNLTRYADDFYMLLISVSTLPFLTFQICR